MMKLWSKAASMVILILLLLNGCAGEQSEMSRRQEQYRQANEPEPTEISEQGVTPAEKPGETIESCNKLYGTQETFQDIYVPEQYLLIGDENVVWLFAVSGCNQIKVMPRSSIERVEVYSFDSFAAVTIFDKTNQSISVNSSPEAATEIAEMLK